ncbi:MAG: flagellar biosynthesis protein FlhB [Pontiellaceae bacterium]|nr:flagellar biosynthesis protein FlhB [Pontiellaceae bacterium]
MAFLFPEEGPDGKTERGSEKKRKDVRKEGKVVFSNEIVTVVVLSAGIAVFLSILPLMRIYLTNFIQSWAQIDVTAEWNADFVQGLFREGTLLCVIGVMPIGLTVVLASTIATIAQTKPFFETEVLKLNFKELNPVTGFKQLFSMDSIIKLLLSILKVLVITLLMWSVIHKQVMELTFLNQLDMHDSIQWFMSIFVRIISRVLALFILVAFLDWVKEKRKYERSIMMTKQEVKDEHKNQESSPQVKQRLRRKMRELSMARMMAAVPDATMVITNPTFIAIAIKYSPEKDSAPIVVAKGKRLTAQRVREIAEENGIPIVERKPLARAMYNKVEVGKPVPSTYYQAVAELLAYLYRMGNARIREQLARRK